jgi:HEPN domain-containing protein
MRGTSNRTGLLKIGHCSKIDESFNAIMNEARNLDMFHIPIRYPNGLVGDLAPTEFYEMEDAEKCINSAESILSIVKRLLIK